MCQFMSVYPFATVCEMRLEMRIVRDERGLKVPCPTTELLARLRRKFTKRPQLVVVASVPLRPPQWRARVGARAGAAAAAQVSQPPATWGGGERPPAASEGEGALASARVKRGADAGVQRA